MEQKVTTPIVKGLIISLLLIVYGLVLYFTDQYMNQALSYAQYVILIGGIIWSCTSYAKQLNGNVTFGNIFAHGFKTTAVVIVIIVVYTFIAVKFLFPEMVDRVLEESRKGMEKQNMSDEQITQALDMTRKFFMPFMIGAIILMFAIAGVISSLIGAAISKKNPQSPFPQQQPM